MAHFAEIDENNIVIRVLVTDNDAPNEGHDWLIQNLGGTWVQTSYNANFRNKFAGIGDFYIEELDAFVSPKPFQSWTLNSATLKWEAPIAKPDTGEFYWDEASVNWVKVEGE